MATLYECYLHEKEIYEQENERNRFCALAGQLLKQGLKLERIGHWYVVSTPDGEAISDEFDTLDEIKAWIKNPVFVFPEPEEEESSDDITVAEVETIIDRLEKMSSVNRRGLLDLLIRACVQLDKGIKRQSRKQLKKT